MSVPLRVPRGALRSPVKFALKAASVLFGSGGLFAARPDLSPLDLARDFDAIDRLLEAEQWPFLRADLELSHAQPRSVAFVARVGGEVAAFYTAHHFGDVGYLDMAVVAPAFRGKGVLRPLHARVVRALKERGMRGLVVHTTNDSAPLVWMLGFDAGQTFTLLARDPAPGAVARNFTASETLRTLGPADRDALVALDGAVFGLTREPWLDVLLAQPGARFYGAFEGGALVAAVCLRPRRGGALCLDAASARKSEDLLRLVDAVLAAHADRRVECFAKDGAALDAALRARGFSVPEFFVAIGPLVEWRKGKTGVAGRNAAHAVPELAVTRDAAPAPKATTQAVTRDAAPAPKATTQAVTRDAAPAPKPFLSSDALPHARARAAGGA